MRIVDQRRMAVNRGATQATIERNTLPHKYKKVYSLLIYFYFFYLNENICVFHLSFIKRFKIFPLFIISSKSAFDHLSVC